MPLPCLVLTAGLGTRLRPLTDLLAKPALPVAGKPLVVRILEWLRAQGVRDAVLNLSHLPHTVSGVVGDGAHLDMRVRYSWEQPVLGSAGGPRHALPLLDASRFLIVNGDTLTNVPLNDVIDAHTRSGAAVTMALVPHPAPGRYGGVQVNDAGFVEAFSARDAAVDGPLWHYIGVQVVEAEVFADLPDNTPAESVGGIYKELLKRGLVAAHRSESMFRDIGRPEDYLATTIDVAHDEGNLSSIVEEAGSSFEAGAALDRVILWRGTHVASGAELTNCIVAGVHVPAGTRATDACLVPDDAGMKIRSFRD